MKEREILGELERLIAELDSIRTEPSEIEKVQNIEHSLVDIREFLLESRARQVALRYRHHGPVELLDVGEEED